MVEEGNALQATARGLSGAVRAQCVLLDFVRIRVREFLERLLEGASDLTVPERLLIKFVKQGTAEVVKLPLLKYVSHWLSAS